MFGTFFSHLVQIFFCNLNTTPSLFGETLNNNRQNSSFEKKNIFNLIYKYAIYIILISNSSHVIKRHSVAPLMTSLKFCSKLTVHTGLQMCKRKFLSIKRTRSYSTHSSGRFFGPPGIHLYSPRRQNIKTPEGEGKATQLNDKTTEHAYSKQVVQ